MNVGPNRPTLDRATSSRPPSPVQKLLDKKWVQVQTPSPPPPLALHSSDQKTSVHRRDEKSQPELCKTSDSKGTSKPSTLGCLSKGTAKDKNTDGPNGGRPSLDPCTSEVSDFSCLTEEAKVVRDLLLSQPEHQKLDNEAVDKYNNSDKQWYVDLTPTALSTSNSTFLINKVPTGTDQFGRISSVIRMKRLFGRISLDTYPGASVANYVQPTIRLIVWIEKIPLVPGTPMACVGTGANPPAGTGSYLVFNRLGIGATQTCANVNAIRDPVVGASQAIVLYDHYHKPHGISMSFNGATVSYGEERIYVDLDIDLQRMHTTFAGGGASVNPLTNALCITALLDGVPAGISYSMDGNLCLLFEDTPLDS